MANTLRELRTSRNIPMDALALVSRCDISTISRIENGKVRAKDDTVIRLAKALGISARRMRKLCDSAIDERSVA